MSPQPPRPRTALPEPLRRAPGGPQRRLSSDALFAGAEELVIEHRGAEYRLRRTSLGKLILTK